MHAFVDTPQVQHRPDRQRSVWDEGMEAITSAAAGGLDVRLGGNALAVRHASALSMLDAHAWGRATPPQSPAASVSLHPAACSIHSGRTGAATERAPRAHRPSIEHLPGRAPHGGQGSLDSDSGAHRRPGACAIDPRRLTGPPGQPRGPEPRSDSGVRARPSVRVDPLRAGRGHTADMTQVAGSGPARRPRDEFGAVAPEPTSHSAWLSHAAAAPTPFTRHPSCAGLPRPFAVRVRGPLQPAPTSRPAVPRSRASF